MNGTIAHILYAILAFVLGYGIYKSFSHINLQYPIIEDMFTAKTIETSPDTANTKAVIKQYDKKAISEVLNREIPDLLINSINIIETGWEHLVAEVNEDLIFRFPRERRAVANLEREKKLLDYLKNHISLPIPDYRYFGTDIAFVGYRKIPGVHLNQQLYAGLDVDVRLNIANTLAHFFTQLHHSVSKERALQMGYAKIIRPLEEIESSLRSPAVPVYIEKMIQEAIVYAKKDLSKEQNLVFIHQDVNGDNSAFNPTTEQITGIFDFSDTGIAPYSWDFAELFFIDPELANLTAEIYAKMNNVPSPLIGGAADYILRKATLIVEARKKGDLQNQKALIEDLHHFIPVWRDAVKTGNI